VRSLVAALLACLVAAAAPVFVAERVEEAPGFPGWPSHWGGRALRPLPLAEREKAFARGFPGRIGRFENGEAQLILRHVTRPTRRLHPAVDCFRGSGYDTRPLSGRRDEAGRSWGCFLATRDGRRLRVCERIEDGAGGSWSDVSSWYWAALLGRSAGPWWAVTRIDPADPGP
jgi:hypothetical protein